MSELNRLRVTLQFAGAAAALALLTTAAPSRAARPNYLPLPPESIYTYDGAIYDRLFSAFAAHSARGTRNAAEGHQSALPGLPYAITDLAAVYYGRLQALDGYPTGVNDSGQITLYDGCGCFSLGDQQGNGGVIMDDTGKEFAELQGVCCPGGGASATPLAIDASGNATGEYDYSIAGTTSRRGNITWGSATEASYFGGADNGSFTLALNDHHVSVGQDTGPKGVFAGAYVPKPGGGAQRILLKPPLHTSWIGTATGINDAGSIVGYATFGKPSAGRAVRFFINGYATELPVGAAGVSTSAQAINVHGDVVGNAGSKAFLYKNNRVTYLPRPPGEEAGNAVAFAINASDEIVGEINNGSTYSAFLYVGGKSYDLNALLPVNSGWTISSAAAINDNGQIVGNGTNVNDPQGGPYSMKPRFGSHSRAIAGVSN